MKYAKEVLGLFTSFPATEFRMKELVNHVGKGSGSTEQEKKAARKAIARVLEAMEDSGSLIKNPPAVGNGGYATYRLRVLNQATAYQNHDMTPIAHHP
ncbi:MAG TPA: hypothetical protein DD666_00760 [Advenella kashmirensis]|uniref:Uncharacterized protein n=1 Tax=Advenella kashmirensis TaxID=310575 RepID=A0A356LA90_9BURK|nr:hypothetical protein [Advenella kashmirensis]